jgi:hypothetical protein
MNQIIDPNTANYYTSYGEQASASLLPFLKFQKGDWTVGQNDDAVADGTEFIADMGTLKTGWTRWWAGKPTETEMVSVALGQTPRRRGELPDNDPNDWERDANGPRDPWQFTNTLELVNPQDGDDRVMLSVSSRGGINAVGALCKAYGSHIRIEPEHMPVIALRSDSYKHTQYGKVFVPLLAVVAWVDRDGNQVEAEDHDARVEAEPVKEPEPAARTRASSRPAVAGKKPTNF